MLTCIVLCAYSCHGILAQYVKIYISQWLTTVYTQNYIVICRCILTHVMTYFNSWIIYNTSNSCMSCTFKSCRGIITHVIYISTNVRIYINSWRGIYLLKLWYKFSHAAICTLTYLTLTQLLLFHVTVCLFRTLLPLIFDCMFMLPFTNPYHVINSSYVYV